MKITLCGSTKFMEAFGDWNVILTIAGHLIYSVAVSAHNDLEPGRGDDDLVKRRLDLVHLAKIEESDAILVLNVGQYIGASTRREIEWATLRGKPVYYLEPFKKGEDYPGTSIWNHFNRFTAFALIEDPNNGLPNNGVPNIAKYAKW